MLQAIGLTSTPHRDRPPEVDDLTFEARPGLITALLGAPGSGKTTALRLMLELEPGRGVTYFRGRPLHKVAHPAREVGTLLGDVPGHPARTVRGQLRLMCAVAGVPAARAEEMLHVVGLDGLGDQRLGTLSLGMDRRLGLAAALLGDPHTLLLDEPAEGLSPRENSWLYGLLRGHAQHGGTVLCTFADPKEAARVADRVVTIDGGRLVADQDAREFARTRLRPRVAVATPHAARLGSLVTREARAARRSVEVVAEDGSHLSVYGTTCAEVGETAFRHGVLVHRLTEEVGDTGPTPPGPRPSPASDLSPTPATAPAPDAAALLPRHTSAPTPTRAPRSPPPSRAPHSAPSATSSAACSACAPRTSSPGPCSSDRSRSPWCSGDPATHRCRTWSPPGRSCCRCRPRRSAPGSSARSPSARSTAIPRSPPTAAPSRADSGCCSPSSPCRPGPPSCWPCSRSPWTRRPCVWCTAATWCGSRRTGRRWRRVGRG